MVESAGSVAQSAESVKDSAYSVVESAESMVEVAETVVESAESVVDVAADPAESAESAADSRLAEILTYVLMETGVCVNQLFYYLLSPSCILVETFTVPDNEIF